MTSTHDKRLSNGPETTTDVTASAPTPVQETPEQIRIEELEEALRNSRAASIRFQEQLDEARIVTAHQAQEIRGYIEQDVVAGKKWRDKFEAAAAELRLLHRANLSSGCGCPIGVCLGGKSTALGGACWVQWAEGFVLKRRGELIIDELRTQASHPARVAAAQRERAQQVKQRIAGSEDTATGR